MASQPPSAPSPTLTLPPHNLASYSLSAKKSPQLVSADQPLSSNLNLALPNQATSEASKEKNRRENQRDKKAEAKNANTVINTENALGSSRNWNSAQVELLFEDKRVTFNQYREISTWCAKDTQLAALRQPRLLKMMFNPSNPKQTRPTVHLTELQMIQWRATGSAATRPARHKFYENLEKEE